MAKIPIWPGSSSFDDIENPTPFGFYDEDSDFREDADKITHFVVKRLGYPLVDIELQDVNIYACFEEAVTEYGGQLYTFQIRNNMIDLEGKATGSSDINRIYIDSNYGITDQASTQGNYGIEGEDQISPTENTAFKLQTGSLQVQRGKQRYDLFTHPSSSISGSQDGAIKMHKIYHYSPAAINRYFDPYAGTGTGIQSLMQTFGMGNYSPGVNFMLMPMYFDILKLQAIELNDAIRKSAYHFDIVDNRYLKLFPIPTRDYTLHFEYQLKSVANNPVKDTTGGITNMSNVPYTNPTYKFINEPGRQWIRRYALALAKEMLGSIRGKYQSIPIPGADTTLDYSRLLGEASSEKSALIEELKSFLEETTRVKQLERQNQEAQLTQETFYKVPYPIYIG